MSATAPTVKTAHFEGPLDLLLELVESRKLLINDISLAAVTEEYLKRLEHMGEMPLGEASEFIALAATLLLIKSRSLLPSLTLTEEETRDIKELEYRLALYQIIKEAARGLGKANHAPALWRGAELEATPLYVPDESATPKNLREAMLHLIEEFPAFTELPKTAVKKVISLEEMIERLATRIGAAAELSFKEFSGHGAKTGEKYHIVVSFLALLELVKQGIARASQSSEFGDIVLQKSAVTTPSYHE